MSPIYQYQCCGKEIEVIQGRDKENPLCPECGAKMKSVFTAPSLITIKGKDGTRTYSKGYKEGYSKEYLRSIGKA